MRTLIAGAAGLVFGLGLTISGMINPGKIIGFLDLAGHWDPSLLFVMLGALAVTGIGYRIAFSRPKPMFEEKFFLPEATAIDRPLIIGAALFGLGWAFAGYCPGPGLTALALGHLEPALFVAAMLTGMALHNLIGDLKIFVGAPSASQHPFIRR